MSVSNASPVELSNKRRHFSSTDTTSSPTDSSVVPSTSAQLAAAPNTALLMVDSDSRFAEPLSPLTRTPADLPSESTQSPVPGESENRDLRNTLQASHSSFYFDDRPRAQRDSTLQNFAFPGSLTATTMQNPSARSSIFSHLRSSADFSRRARHSISNPYLPSPTVRARTWPSHRSNWDRFLTQTAMLRNALLAECDALAYQVNYLQGLLANLSRAPSGSRRSTSGDTQWPSRINEDDGNPIPRVTTPERVPSIANPLFDFSPPMSLPDSGGSSMSMSIQSILGTPPPLLPSPVSEVGFSELSPNHEWEEVSELATVMNFNAQQDNVATAPPVRRRRPIELPRSSSIASWRTSLLHESRFSTGHFDGPLLGLQQVDPTLVGQSIPTPSVWAQLSSQSDGVIPQTPVQLGAISTPPITPGNEDLRKESNQSATPIASSFSAQPALAAIEHPNVLWNITLLLIGAATAIGVQAVGEYFGIRFF
ncbi:hypothetical protein FRC02_008256 [Tulasnella sp. 418]|nr:hypothetical protein FRC02_008256 [Tulasnella sp. 418]